eukprot:6053936-Alexandrium_andersonii.AAC.1
MARTHRSFSRPLRSSASRTLGRTGAGSRSSLPSRRVGRRGGRSLCRGGLGRSGSCRSVHLTGQGSLGPG